MEQVLGPQAYRMNTHLIATTRALMPRSSKP
jgi:hypothetical protein